MNTIKKGYALRIIIIAICIGIASIIALICSYKSKPVELDNSHIYVCDNPEYLSDFDTWIKEDLGVSWVPSYIIVKDGFVIGAFDGCIDTETFDDKLGTVLAMNLQFEEVPNLEISNIEDNRVNANELFRAGTYIIEVHLYGCKDCEYQDEHYTKDIYKKYGTQLFYRYYIKSAVSDVQELFLK